jgi:hypothetical protein
MVRERSEEEDFGEEEGDGEATLEAWAEVLADEFIVPIVGPVLSKGTAEWKVNKSCHALVVRRRKKGYRKDVFRVELVFDEFIAPRPRGLFAALSRRFDIARATVRFWYGHWVCYPEWRPYGRVTPGNRRIFSDELEEKIVTAIEETFWAEERKLSRRTFRDFVKMFWFDHRREIV